MGLLIVIAAVFFLLGIWAGLELSDHWEIEADKAIRDHNEAGSRL